jgi:hypothetical protein
MYEAYQLTYNYQENHEILYSKIQAKLNSQNNKWFRENCLGEPIAGNRTWKNLICMLSDYFDEIDQGTTLDVLQELFSSNFDIEHIHANANEIEGNDINEELQNSIGNLMLLEYDINRSIGCLPFCEKKERSDGGMCYKDSNYASVKKIRKYSNWGLHEIEQRRKKEIEKISNFLFNS